MKIYRSTLFGAAAALALAGAAHAQSPGMAHVAVVSATASPAHVARGGKGLLTVTLAVAPQFHVNAHKLSDPDLIATDFAPAAGGGVTYGAARYPAPKMIKLAGKPSPVYMGRTTIVVPFTVAKTARAGKAALGGQLTYQGCNATSCFPPKTVAVKAAVSVQ